MAICWGCGKEFERPDQAGRDVTYHSRECRKRFHAHRTGALRHMAHELLQWERHDRAGNPDKAALILIALRRECRAINETDSTRREK